MKYKPFFFALIALFTLSSCNTNNPIVPKYFHGYVVGFLAQPSARSGSMGVKNEHIFHFHDDDSYESFRNQEINNAGEYSYHRESTDTAVILLTYSTLQQNYDYKIALTFKDAQHGTWETTYFTNQAESDEGTFTIFQR